LCANRVGSQTPAEYQEASELLVQNISKLSDSMNQYLAQTEVETFEITEDQELVELSPQDLQGQITRKCVATIPRAFASTRDRS